MKEQARLENLKEKVKGPMYKSTIRHVTQMTHRKDVRRHQRKTRGMQGETLRKARVLGNQKERLPLRNMCWSEDHKEAKP